jgi:hypothetical protein
MPVDPLTVACPNCGTAYIVKPKRVVDTPAVPAEAHWEYEIEAVGGGLFNANEEMAKRIDTALEPKD